MKKKLITISIALLMVFGLSLLLYPLVANTWNSYRQDLLLSNYDEKVYQAVENGTIDYEKEKATAEKYNDELIPCVLPDSFAVAAARGEESEEFKKYMSCLNLTGDGIMGKVKIPKIGVNLPIFHTTAEDVLEIGAGHLEGSTLPVGGKGTHSVISAHRGLPTASLFTDLDKLEIGDNFFIEVLNGTLAYEVDQILVVEPEETESLAVVEGEDLVTLLTCTPYGMNTQRLMVRGHRVPYSPDMIEEGEAPLGAYSFHTNYVFWVVVGLLITGAFILLLYLLDKKRRKS
ncbi:MAG: class C sortase [Agathobacter sp.]|nr:class C sortase [Agathobacter sp.]